MQISEAQLYHQKGKLNQLVYTQSKNGIIRNVRPIESSVNSNLQALILVSVVYGNWDSAVVIQLDSVAVTRVKTMFSFTPIVFRFILSTLLSD